MKVKNMQNAKGNSIANQFIITDERYTYFQSYDSIVAKVDHEHQKITLDKCYWDYSKTTGKYRNLFLNETKAITQKKIDSGEYKLANLN